MGLRFVLGGDRGIAGSDIFFRCGSFAYRLDAMWAKLPRQLSAISVNGGSFDKQGNLYAATGRKDIPLIRFDDRGKLSDIIGEGLFLRPHSVFVTPWETLLCADTGPGINVVREISMAGRMIRDFGELGKAGDSGFDPDAFINAKIGGKIPADEPRDPMKEYYIGQETIVRAGGPCNMPTGMVVAPCGDMYISDGLGNAAVHRFDMNGRYISTWGGPGGEPGRFRGPHGLFADKLNRVIVADRDNNRVQVFDRYGTLLAVVDNLMTPECVWADEENIFVGETGGITILDMDLNIAAQIGYKGSNLMCHGISGRAEGELFIFTAAKGRGTNILRLIRA